MIPFLPIEKVYRIGIIPVPVWGVVFAIAAIAFIIIYIIQAEKYKISSKQVVSSLIHFGFWGFLGMHTYHILFVNHKFENLLKVNGGNDSAGVIFGLIALIIYVKWNKIGLRKYFDMLALPLITIATFVRIGCFLIADEYGTKTVLPWAIYHGTALRHPISLYYFIISAIILGILVYLNNKKLKSGNLFIYALLMYSSTRILLDFLRVSPPHNYFGLSVHQIAYGIFLLIGIALYVINNNTIDKIKKKLK